MGLVCGTESVTMTLTPTEEEQPDRVGNVTDQLIALELIDGCHQSHIVQLADGTSIECSAEAVKSGERGEVKINAEGFPPVKVNPVMRKC